MPELDQHEPPRPYDPWQKVKTIHGANADEVISTLQKEIRRGHEENAVIMAYEMLKTSEELEDYLWKRLKAICVEDIGFGDTQAPILINALDQMRHSFPRGAEGVLYAIHAVRYLANCKKDRSDDEMIDYLDKGFEEGTLKIEIPDYAYDMHTLKGQKMKRGYEHFDKVAAQIYPEYEGRNKKYYNEIMKIYKYKEYVDAELD
ncbi:MAG: hypothetical protein J5800_00420 [Spirochaetales bacterium]|nr:hypothetical protein [Spirochaetales bacterium]